jgi:hypothetical protein
LRFELGADTTPVGGLAAVDEAAVDGFMHLIRRLVPLLHPLLQRFGDDSRQVVVELGAPIIADPVKHAWRMLIHVSRDLSLGNFSHKTKAKLTFSMHSATMRVQAPYAPLNYCPHSFRPILSLKSLIAIQLTQLQLVAGWGGHRNAVQELALGLEGEETRDHLEQRHPQRPEISGIRRPVGFLRSRADEAQDQRQFRAGISYFQLN